MPTHLVTGGAGFIGSHIATKLVEQGDAVRVLDNLSTGKPENLAHLGDRIEFIKADLLDTNAVHAAAADCEIVFHQAALASVPRSVADPLETNATCVTGTLNVLQAARAAKVKRVVYAGSSSAYGNAPPGAIPEHAPLQPVSPYAAAKLAGEAYCQAFFKTYGLETVVIRYFNVFGPRQDPKSEYSAVIPLFVTAMLASKQPTVFGDGLQSRDFTYVEDIVAGNLAAATGPKAAGRVLNIATGKQLTLLDLIGAINRSLGTTIEPRFAEVRVGDVRESLADITAAREALGFTPGIDFDEGLRRSIDYYRSLT